MEYGLFRTKPYVRNETIGGTWPPIGYDDGEVARMGRRCKLLDVPTKAQLIEKEWRFDHTINQFVVYL